MKRPAPESKLGYFIAPLMGVLLMAAMVASVNFRNGASANDTANGNTSHVSPNDPFHGLSVLQFENLLGDPKRSIIAQHNDTLYSLAAKIDAQTGRNFEVYSVIYDGTIPVGESFRVFSEPFPDHVDIYAGNVVSGLGTLSAPFSK